MPCQMRWDGSRLAPTDRPERPVAAASIGTAGGTCHPDGSRTRTGPPPLLRPSPSRASRGGDVGPLPLDEVDVCGVGTVSRTQLGRGSSGEAPGQTRSGVSRSTPIREASSIAASRSRSYGPAMAGSGWSGSPWTANALIVIRSAREDGTECIERRPDLRRGGQDRRGPCSEGAGRTDLHVGQTQTPGRLRRRSSIGSRCQTQLTTPSCMSPSPLIRLDDRDQAAYPSVLRWSKQ